MLANLEIDDLFFDKRSWQFVFKFFIGALSSKRTIMRNYYFGRSHLFNS
jgi:hypothetical protein